MARSNAATIPQRIAVVVRPSTAIPDSIEERLSRFRQGRECITLYTRENAINRDGIDRLVGDMTMRRLDVLLVGEISDLTRVSALFYELISKAVDHGVRVIVADIGLDTSDADWVSKLKYVL